MNARLPFIFRDVCYACLLNDTAVLMSFIVLLLATPDDSDLQLLIDTEQDIKLDIHLYNISLVNLI